MTDAPEPKIFCLGLNKTGTTTLGECLERLGFGPVVSPDAIHARLQPESWRELLPDANALMLRPERPEAPFGEHPLRRLIEEVCLGANYPLAVALARRFRTLKARPWNVPPMHRVFDEHFPGSRFILTYRDPESWWASVDRWLNVTHRDDEPKRRRYLQHMGLEAVDRAAFLDHYARHNAEMRAWFAGRDDFLELDFEAGQGWAELCTFLDVPVPDAPLPHRNRQEYGETSAPRLSGF